MRWRHGLVATQTLGVTAGARVGVIGFGGIGNLATRLAIAYHRVVKGDVRYRYVIDMASLRSDQAA